MFPALLSFFFAALSLLLPAVVADPDTITLPQCANVTLTWTSGAAPYTAVVEDVTTGKSQTFTPDTNTLLWPVDAAIGDAVSFIVVDSANVTSAGGPFNVVTSSVTSCLGGNDLLSDITGGLLKRAESIDIELRSMGPPAVLDDRRSGSAWSLRRPGPLRRARRRAARVVPHSSP